MASLRRREPIFSMPGVVMGLFAVMAAIQAAQTLVDDARSLSWLTRFAFVPARLTQVFDPRGVAAALGPLSGQARETALFFLGNGGAPWWTVLTYAFFHAGWAHLLANSLWLVAFGSPVARRIGSARFLVLFCAAAIGGAIAQWIANPFGFEPVVGASAGVSGVMAAAARFVFQPGGPAFSQRPFEGRNARALSVLGCFRDSRALAFIVIWFLVNLAIGLAAVPLGISEAPIAWQAHIGGFLVGLLLFSALDPPPAAHEEEAAASEFEGP